jgi:hypothetical protein
MTASRYHARALAASLRRAQLLPQDEAAKALARKYAALLDEATGTPQAQAVYDALGPKYLAVLTALRLTPAGRGVKGGAVDAPPGVTPLTRIREHRAGQRTAARAN